MRSHDLAKALLARRDNEVLIEVLLDDGSAAPATGLIHLRDHEHVPDHLRVRPGDAPVGYYPVADAIVIYAGDALTGPHRDDATAAWLKRHRETYRESDGAITGAWRVIDAMLDDYREHADCGTPLSEDVEGPHPEER